MAIDAFSELDDYANDLLKISDTLKKGKVTKKFIRAEGRKLKKKTIKVAKEKVTNEKTGNYVESIATGKAYSYHKNNALSLRVYSTAPHAHLIEYGHIKKAPYTKQELGFVPGKHVFETASDQYEEKFYKNAEKFIEKCLNDHGLY